MYIEIITKLLSESLLSLYPVFVKLINLPIFLQIWSRAFTYTIISVFFINLSYVSKYLFSKYGMSLSVVTLIHVYASYRGFQLLNSGVAYVIFYTYPLIILIMAGEKINLLFMFIALLGVYLLSDKNEKKEEFNENKERFWNEGIIMMIIAAFTEALIYFLVKKLDTKNNWNHIFISYALSAIVLSLYFKNNITKINLKSNLSFSLLINSFIGLLGYLLRFYSITRLSTLMYSILSYFGILMAFIYGFFLNNDIITIKQIVGGIFILIPNIYFLLNK